jgi:hypothetical protein
MAIDTTVAAGVINQVVPINCPSSKQCTTMDKSKESKSAKKEVRSLKPSQVSKLTPDSDSGKSDSYTLAAEDQGGYEINVCQHYIKSMHSYRTATQDVFTLSVPQEKDDTVSQINRCTNTSTLALDTMQHMSIQEVPEETRTRTHK